MDLRRHFALGFVALCGSCSWTRFDELEKNTPVVLLKRPGAIPTGFGSSLSASKTEAGATLLVGGLPGASTGALFDLGSEEAPTLDAIGTGYCRSENMDLCYLAAQTAAIGPAILPGGDRMPQCFAVGVGSAGADRPLGVVVECENQRGGLVGYSLAAPVAFAKELELSIQERERELVVMAASGGDSSALLIGSARHQSAWFYRTPDFGAAPVELLPPGEPEQDYGATVAAVELGGQRLFAVGAPEAGSVHLFLSDSEEAPEYLGCLGAGPGFGRALAVGPVPSGDALGALLISDQESVHVLLADRLLELESTGGCTLQRLPTGALFAALGCSPTGDAKSCEGSDFGQAVAAGDFDGDGDGEVAVAAPKMRVREVDQAGAILIYDLENADDTDPVEARFISSAQNHDLLGNSLGVVQLGNRQLLAASAPGNGKVALFYCLELLPEALLGARCR